MCRIAYLEKRKLTKDEIIEAHKYNSDGIGIGWAKDGFTHFVKGFKTTKAFMEFYKDFDHLPHVIHFRRASIGGASQQLCHPFHVMEEPEDYLGLSGSRSCPLLFHNGTWSEWIESFFPYAIMSKGKFNLKEWSDSRFIALLVHKFGPDVFAKIPGQYGPGRYALIKPTGEIELYGEWVERDEVLYSNLKTYDTHITSSITIRK